MTYFNAILDKTNRLTNNNDVKPWKLRKWWLLTANNTNSLIYGDVNSAYWPNVNPKASYGLSLLLLPLLIMRGNVGVVDDDDDDDDDVVVGNVGGGVGWTDLVIVVNGNVKL